MGVSVFLHNFDSVVSRSLAVVDKGVKNVLKFVDVINGRPLKTDPKCLMFAILQQMKLLSFKL